MKRLRFDWDPRKAAANHRKHRVSFEEAQTVFFDEEALLISDPEHSDDEDRFVLVGISSGFRILTVCHTYRRRDELIRIISARRASRAERTEYERKCP
jgi:uncharacterized DUF497 family protein